MTGVHHNPIPQTRTPDGRFACWNSLAPDSNVVHFDHQIRRVMARKDRSWLVNEMTTKLTRYGAYPVMIPFMYMAGPLPENRVQATRQLL